MKNTKHFINQLVEDKEKFIFKCLKGEMENRNVWTIVWYSIAGLGIYGFTLGFIHSWEQALASTFKVPLIFYISSGVCFPTLYLFLSLLGIKY